MARKRHTVAALVPKHVSPFELAVACEVFGFERPEIVSPWYRFLVCAAEEGPVTTDMGFTIHTPYGLADLRKADTVIVPAGVGVDEKPPEPMLEALRAAHKRGARILSVCTGAFVLAAAGLLDGRRATTHWMHADLLAERYPNVKVDPKVLYVEDGNVMTSAGTAAGIDLCLHVVRLDYGAEVANAVARRMVVPPHRDGGQAQYVDQPVPTSDGDGMLADVLAWMEEHLDEQMTVEALARRAAMSPRHFARRFRAVTGTTPHHWLLTQRVLYAQRLLERTDQSIELIASRCGFGTAANLRQHFQRVVGTSPAAYRRTFHSGVLVGDQDAGAR
ncbi:MAG TPA: transcriptional regulator FtrA [Acidimicrobiales bacterium]|nr:transcriptional regulator FtrA [Acidimicrobiales bacterium]